MGGAATLSGGRETSTGRVLPAGLPQVLRHAGWRNSSGGRGRSGQRRGAVLWSPRSVWDRRRLVRVYVGGCKRRNQRPVEVTSRSQRGPGAGQGCPNTEHGRSQWHTEETHTKLTDGKHRWSQRYDRGAMLVALRQHAMLCDRRGETLWIALHAAGLALHSERALTSSADDGGRQAAREGKLTHPEIGSTLPIRVARRFLSSTHVLARNVA